MENDVPTLAQLKGITMRNLGLQYKGSVLGFFWVLLEPILYMVILSFVFTRILRFEMDRYPLFLLAALLPWNFFSRALSDGTTSIIHDANLVKSVTFRRELLPIAAVLSNFISLLFGLVLFVAVLIVVRTPVTPAIGLLPFILVFHMLFTVGLALLLSVTNAYYRDVNNFVKFGLMLWFYLTPVFYPVSMVPADVALAYRLNPMVSFVSAYRSIMLDGLVPGRLDVLSICLAGTLVAVLGYVVFRRYESGLAKVV